MVTWLSAVMTRVTKCTITTRLFHEASFSHILNFKFSLKGYGEFFNHIFTGGVLSGFFLTHVRFYRICVGILYPIKIPIPQEKLNPIGRHIFGSFMLLVFIPHNSAVDVCIAK